MSKSLNNFFTIREILKQHNPEVLRFFLISGHYRSELAYSEANLDNAHAALSRLYRSLEDLEVGTSFPDDSSFEEKFNQAMSNDFNTPEALAVLFEISKQINRLKEDNLSEAKKFGNLLRKLAKVLGILENSPDLFFKGEKSIDESQINRLILDRQAAKDAKDWATADRIRDELNAMGISLEDKAGKTSWRVI